MLVQSLVQSLLVAQIFPLAHVECNKDESFKLNGI